MFNLVKEDVFTWYPFRVGEDKIEERYCVPEYLRDNITQHNPGRDTEDLMKLPPETYRRRVYRHQGTGLYFMFLACEMDCFVNVGFLPGIDSLNECSFLPDFDLDYAQYSSGDDDIVITSVDDVDEPPCRQPEPLPDYEKGCKIFLEKMAELIPIYEKRNRAIKPISDSVKSRLRDSAMAYDFLAGRLTIPSKIRVELIRNEPHITGSVRTFLSDGESHESACTWYSIRKLKDTGVWYLNSSEEEALFSKLNGYGTARASR